LASDRHNPASGSGTGDPNAIRLCKRRTATSGRTGDAANPDLVAAAQLLVADYRVSGECRGVQIERVVGFITRTTLLYSNL
jgi:hypothetical protein